MARRPPHLRWIYVKDHPRPFLALVAATAFVLAAVALLLSDPARGLTFGAIPVGFGVVVWALTNRAGYPDRDPTSLPHERHDLEPEVGQSTSTVDAEPTGGEWDPFAGQRRAVGATAAPADPFEQPTDAALPSDGRKRLPGRKTLPSEDAEPEKTEAASAVAQESKVRKAHPRRWEDKTAEPTVAPDRTASETSKRREPASQKRRKDARSDAMIEAGDTAVASKRQARQQKGAAPQGAKQSSRKRADGGKAQQGGRSNRPQSAEGAEPTGQQPKPLTPAESAIQAAAARKAKRHRKTG